MVRVHQWSSRRSQAVGRRRRRVVLIGRCDVIEDGAAGNIEAIRHRCAPSIETPWADGGAPWPSTHMKAGRVHHVSAVATSRTRVLQNRFLIRSSRAIPQSAENGTTLHEESRLIDILRTPRASGCRPASRRSADGRRDGNQTGAFVTRRILLRAKFSRANAKTTAPRLPACRFFWS